MPVNSHNYISLPFHPCRMMPGVVQVERRPRSATCHSTALAWDGALGLTQHFNSPGSGRVGSSMGDRGKFCSRNHSKRMKLSASIPRAVEKNVDVAWILRQISCTRATSLFGPPLYLGKILPLSDCWEIHRDRSTTVGVTRSPRVR